MTADGGGRWSPQNPEAGPGQQLLGVAFPDISHGWLVGGSGTILAVLSRPQFAYVANSGDRNVSGYTIDLTTGALTPIAGSPFPAGEGPASVAVDPSGTFAYVTNSGDGNVSGYTIDLTTGALTEIAGSPFKAGSSPNSVAFTPRIA
jgi:6-phosphogluconolactonase